MTSTVQHRSKASDYSFQGMPCYEACYQVPSSYIIWLAVQADKMYQILCFDWPLE